MLSPVTTPEKTHETGSLAARQRSHWWILALKIVAWQLLAIFVVELSLSVAGLGEEEIFKLDPLLGCKHMCNKKVTWRSEGFATSYLNADGMREHGLTVAKAPGTYRVAVLGDSLAESLQVPFEEAFAYQIQESLTRQLSRPLQFLNFGVSGYSTAQEYLQLKQQVLKYKPDLVLVCYNMRDCFENWSPPDEVLTNVRPTALHLPGRQLVVDSSSVAQWIKSPRARFLQKIEFLRQNSRLWGIFAAAELDWSLHNNTYKKLLLLVTRPGRAIRETISELKAYWQDGCRQICAGMSASARTAASRTDAEKPLETQRENAAQAAATAAPAAGNPKAGGATATGKSAGEQKGRSTYLSLIERTLGSLLAEMKTTSNAGGAQFAVVIVPVHSALSAKSGMESSADGFDFNAEVKMLQAVCREKGVDLIDIHEKAKALSAQEKDSLFYMAHLTPKGQEFMARQLEPDVKEYVARGSLK